jgi:hypothetical protein
VSCGGQLLNLSWNPDSYLTRKESIDSASYLRVQNTSPKLTQELSTVCRVGLIAFNSRRSTGYRQTITAANETGREYRPLDNGRSVPPASASVTCHGVLLDIPESVLSVYLSAFDPNSRITYYSLALRESSAGMSADRGTALRCRSWLADGRSLAASHSGYESRAPTSAHSALGGRTAQQITPFSYLVLVSTKPRQAYLG